MVVLEQLNAHHALFLVLVELLLPLPVELLELLVSDFDVLAQLVFLNISSEFVLVLVDVGLEQPDLPHQILIECVLLYVAQFLSEDLHFLFDEGEYENLFVFVELTIATLIEDLQEFVGCRKPQTIIYLLFLRFKNQSNVRFIQGAFIPEIRFPNSLPYLLALSGTANKRFTLGNELINLVLGVVSEGAQGGTVTDASPRGRAHRCLEAVHIYKFVFKLICLIFKKYIYFEIKTAQERGTNQFNICLL